jgi:hypothetical protein
MECTNENINCLYNIYKLKQKEKIAEPILNLLKNLLISDNPKKDIIDIINDNNILATSNKIISIFQSNKSTNGRLLENILSEIFNKYDIPFQTQVPINISTGVIQEKNKKFGNTNLDFVIGKNIVSGKNISNYIFISTKISCRERYTQDQWTLQIQPKLYLLVTLSNDYPITKFIENEKRKIITSNPKVKDKRKYKLIFEDLIKTIKEYNV